MKKQAFPILLAITGLFLAFTIGVFIGRNARHGDIEISEKTAVPMHADKSPILPATEPLSSEPVIVYPLNINSATLEELTTLPGIGETLAQRILDYRQNHGAFSSPEELLNVEGIGALKLEAILDLITTGGHSS